jgi:hypothetical protein
MYLKGATMIARVTPLENLKISVFHHEATKTTKEFRESIGRFLRGLRGFVVKKIKRRR